MTEIAPGIVTANGASLAEFYCAGLGFTVTDHFEFPAGEVRRLRRDAASVKIFEPTGGAADPPQGSHWSSYRGFAYSALYVADADAEVERAVAAGAAVLSPVTAHRPGARAALLADPEGNVLEILQEGSVE